MTISDPVAGMLTVIRNAVIRKKKEVIKFPFSTFKEKICQKLVEKKFLSTYSIEEREIAVKINFVEKQPRITAIKKISTPTKRIHLKVSEMNKFCRRGLYIISTSSGLLTNKEAREKNIGGKVILLIR